MDILVRNQYTPRQILQARLKSMEFRRNRTTSGSANLDNQTALGKSVILCDSHVRKFNFKSARYRPHPDPKLRRVVGNCDVCKQFGLSFLFLNEVSALEEHKKLEKFKRALEYATIITN